MDKTQNHIEIEILEILNKDQLNFFWIFYLNFLKNYKSSVQSKPVIFERIKFDNIVNNRNVLKVIFKKNNHIMGYWLATENLTNYPESHYSEDYFKYNIIKLKEFASFQNVKPIFLIGDNCGFILSKDTDDMFKNGNVKFEDVLKKLKEALIEKVHSDIFLVLNYSELSLKVSNLHFAESIMQANRNNHLSNHFTILDEETFVHIYWKGNYTKKTRAEWLLRTIGFFSKNRNGSGDSKLQSKIVYEVTNPLIRDKFIVMRRDVIPDEKIATCYHLYHDRLRGANKISPQKLEYSYTEFFNYLKDPGFTKYILVDKNHQIKGLYLLIGKENSHKAHWVSASWRIADAYIKLILTQKGVPAFGYLLLFVAGTRDLLKEQGTDTESRVLADWSEKINGKRFREDLNISMAPLLPKILTRSVIKNRGQLFAEVLTGLARINAVQIDTDVYLMYH
jgi:hypothetical protein